MCKQPYEKFTQMHEALYIVLGFGAKGRVLFLVIAQYMPLGRRCMYLIKCDVAGGGQQICRKELIFPSSIHMQKCSYSMELYIRSGN